MSDVKGQVGFKDLKDKQVITKEESMFKVDEKGKVIPEVYPIKIYDRDLDMELAEEAIMLMRTIKTQKATSSAVKEFEQKLEKEITELKEKIEKEKDEKIRNELKKEMNIKENLKETEAVKSKVNSNIVSEGIKESRELIEGLKAEKEKQIKANGEKYVELAPCNSSEAYLSFEKGKTIDGKPTDDWVSDLISKKVTKPCYTFEEAKKLKLDYKIALKEAIMEASNYKLKNYRDIMTEKKLQDEKPLTLKKE